MSIRRIAVAFAARNDVTNSRGRLAELGRLAIATLGLAVLSAHANTTETSVPATVKEDIKKYQIAAQPISAALKAFAAQSGMQLIYTEADVGQAQTAGINGELTPRDALSTILKGTNLQFEFTANNVIVVRKVEPRAARTTSLLQGGTAEGDDSSAADSSKSARRIRLAQAEPQTDSQRKGRDSSLQVEDFSAPMIAEIVVTAQKRAERLIDTPISIGVLMGDALERSGTRDVFDALSQVAGTSVLPSQPGRAQIAVRGVISGSGTSTTAFYLDEVPIAFTGRQVLPDANAFDLSRVEVLRGPQGTLYGASALSGVVRVLANDANLDEFEAKGRVNASDTDRGAENYGGDLAINVPLIPGELAVRGVASYSDLSGYVDSTFDGQRGINDSQVQGYRLKVSYRPTENLSFKLGYTRSDVENGAPPTSSDAFTTQFSSNQPAKFVYDVYNLVTEYSWPSVSLLSSTSYVDYTWDETGELPIGGRLVVVQGVGLDAVSQEFRLASRLDGPWQWTAGAIYKDQKDTSSQFTPFALALFPFPFLFERTSESYGIFGELTRAFADGKWELTGGVRYFEDELMSKDISSLTTGTNVPGPQTTTFDQVTWRGTLAWKPEADRTFYASASTGFRGGLHQTASVAPLLPPLDPDTLLNYEVGAKGALLDGTLVYDAAVFYMDWQDIQQNLTLPIGFNAFVNAGSASGMGAEGSLTWQASPALTLYGNVGWNDLQLDQDVFSRGVTLFNEGARTNNSPEWTGTIGGSYRIATGMPNMDVVLSTNYSYRSEIMLRILSGLLVRQTESADAHTWDARIGLAWDKWSVEIYGDNLTNEDAPFIPPGQDGSSIRQRPRTIGLQATFAY